MKHVLPSLFILGHVAMELVLYLFQTKYISSYNIQSCIENIIKTRYFTYLYTFLTYFSSSFFDPGYLDISWLSKVQHDANFVEEPAENGERNLCDKCIIPRPLRCHHCSQCNKCVLIMDHHCYFTDNCIGYKNYKSFYLFLLIYPIHSILTLILTVDYVIQTGMNLVSILICLLWATVFISANFVVIPQLYYQTKSLILNMTFIEESMLNTHKKLYIIAKKECISPYNVGIIDNIKCRFGSNPLMWLIPFCHGVNPYYFKKNPEYIPIYKLNLSPFSAIIDDKDELLKRYKHGDKSDA